VGAELREAATWAVLSAIGAILLYIWFRFEWQFGLGAVIALVHDVISTIGLFALLQLEFNLATVAAILTIAGYSINDTVVVYDRVRENMRRYKKMAYEELFNISINQTLSRTVVTSVTTLLALFLESYRRKSEQHSVGQLTHLYRVLVLDQIRQHKQRVVKS